MMRQASLIKVSLVSIMTCMVAQVRKDDRKSENQPPIVGTWELVSTEERLTDGSKRPYLDVGPHGQGYLMYTADGHMCAAGMNPDRPRWKDVNTPTETEKLRAIDGFLVIADATKLTHSIMRSITIQKLLWIRMLSEPSKSAHTSSILGY
jgi:Lipocalin-like domain